MTRLYKITDQGPKQVGLGHLAKEEMLQRWIADRPQLLGLDLLIIGKEVETAHGGRIDLLGLDAEGSLAILELKRDQTPRDVIAQILDYASWVTKLSTREVQEIAERYLERRLDLVFQERFSATLPETLNENHSMIIIASKFDASSHRIVRYLSEEHDLAINTAFFTVFEDNGQLFLTTEWLLDQAEVAERSGARTRAKMSADALVQMAAERGILSLVNVCRLFAKKTEEEAASTYGGSFRYWFKGKMIFGVNVSGGRRRSPAGTLDVWTSIQKLAELIPLDPLAVRAALVSDFDTTEAGQTECVVRLTNIQDADRLMVLLYEWVSKAQTAESAP